MTWVSIDSTSCNSCGICVEKCLLNCFTEEQGEISVYADESNCCLCGHCVASCPTESISHSQMDMDNFTDCTKDLPIGAEDFFELVRRRRSHRNYKDKEVPKAILEQLIEMCRYCPTGSNQQQVQIKIISNREKLDQLGDLTFNTVMANIQAVQKQVEDLVEAGQEIPKELVELGRLAGLYTAFGATKEAGGDPVFHGAPLVMIFHGPTGPSTPKEDCVLAAQTVILGATTLGLGSCYIGLLVTAANSSPEIMEALQLPEDNKVHTAIVLGYPKIKFQKTIDRSQIQVQWDE